MRLSSVKNWPLRLASDEVIGRSAPCRSRTMAPKEVVVDPRELKRGQRRKGRERKRHDDLPVLLPDTHAVDARRVVQRLRQELHIVAEDERTEAALECHVDEDQTPHASIELA